MVELQAVFSAGAWAAVVILAAVVVDAQFREARGGPERPAPEERRWLRRLRNALVHEARGSSSTGCSPAVARCRALAAAGEKP